MSSSDEDDYININPLLRALFMRGRVRLGTNEELIEHLKDQGVLESYRIEHALLEVPRGLFVTEDMLESAYTDSPLRFSKMGFNISAPHMYAMCLEKLQINDGDMVLDIGCGSGHFTVLAAYLAGSEGFAHGLDIHNHIIEFSRKNYERFKETVNIGYDLNIEFECRNCFLPDVHGRTYDKIHIAACVPESHLSYLTDLLNPGGILVTPFGDRLIKITKNLDGELEEETFSHVRYSDLILPSEAEILEAQRNVQSQRAKLIKVPESTIVRDLSACLNSEKFSDITFECEGKIIYAHKFILQMRSEHFQCLFNSGLRESQSGVIHVNDFDYDTFYQVLTFIYTDDCLINEDNCSELIRAADFYQLDRLKALCELFWFQDITIENAGHLLAFAERYSANQLRNYTLEFIFENISEVTKTESWKEIDQDTLTYILLESVSRQQRR